MKKKGLSEMWLEAGVENCLRSPMKGMEISIIPPAEDSEPEFDPPDGSVWIVAVDYAGKVTVLDTPNIHDGFLDNGPEAEYLGLPPDVDDLDPGVYRWTCSYHTSTDWESGICDGWDFHVEESVLLWSPHSD
ncbi:hypothetical protein CB7_236 [Pectobacterium phage vB_PatM_CB7]|nr:hypothetical protein CB7_236 [Pectobacterium phage vB_PatM_CB7]